MAEKYQPGFVAREATDAGVIFDEGLRTHMLKVYNYMTSGILLTGIIAMYVGNSPAILNSIFGSGLGIVVMLAPLGFVLAMSFGLNKMKASTLQVLFWAFAGVMGLSLSTIFIQYTGASIARVFFITAIMFASLSLYGYTTKKSLSGWGTFLFMGLIGIIIASIVNMFMQSSAMQFIISVAGVLIFAGLTAYDTQKIKEMYYEADGAEIASKKAVMGALTLYLDFINMFLMLLRLFGNRN
ncbi:MAG: Bax inhibitor-1/YccA family protein [Sphingomonadales bacterium]|nr:Bax inhibitor-1/YccA family protein [Sphingomonadales bacterium]